MRILLVTNYLPPYEGGIQFVVDALARGYRAAGWEVEVAGFDPAGAKRGPVDYDVVALGGINPLERFSVPIPLFEPVGLRRRLVAAVDRADAVHGHGLLYPDVLAAIVMAGRRGRPAVLTEHVGLVSMGNRIVDRGQHLALRGAARLVAPHLRAAVVLNERVHAEMVDLLGPGVPVERIDNGVDTQRFMPPNDDERAKGRADWGLDRPTVLFVGRRSRKKGLDLVTATARRLPDVEVLICGKDTESLTGTALPDNVRVVGLVDQERLSGLYRAADVLLLPSEGEGFPLVVQEALASGMGVVVGEHTLPEIARDELPVVSAPRTAEALAAAVRTVLDGDRVAAARASRDAVVARFDWSATCGRYLDLLGVDPPSPSPSSSPSASASASASESASESASSPRRVGS